tara:strand:+ start:760 stop:990 length:231 start_codon:yes stop_codon:yes gene_type:complete
MIKFVTYVLRWISQNLAIPFWMVGHIHLTYNVYADVKEIIVSLGLNIIVAIGFFLDYYKEYKDDRAENSVKENKRT